jgi:histidinol-phosphate phosphatase family protein
MKLVILAGGKGTRLGLKDVPKPMVEINGKPLLEHQIEFSKRYGIDEIFILSGYLSDVIINYFGDGSKWNVKINHIVEPYPLGTAGSLKQLEGRLSERFLVFYGDVVMDFDLKSFIDFDNAYSNSIASIVVHPNNHPYDSDLVEINKNNEVTDFLSKPHDADLIYRNLVNAAVYIFSPKILDFIEKDKGSDFGKNIFPLLLKEKQKIIAYDTAEYIKDMGTKDRFKKVENDLKSGKVARLNKKNLRSAIFIDRDGVLIRDMDKNPTVENFQLLENVKKSISKINDSDYLPIVITNQPMAAKGFIKIEDIENVHKKLETSLGSSHAFVQDIYYCPHHPEKGFKGEVKELKIKCDCRKPGIGLFLKAKEKFNINTSSSWMIGDRETDMLAGKNFGCRTILVGKTILTSNNADYQFLTFEKAVDFIINDLK